MRIFSLKLNELSLEDRCMPIGVALCEILVLMLIGANFANQKIRAIIK
jgi:hypothetical protein